MSSVQTTITQLPTAAPLTGTESVPVVQGGQTRQTTTGAIATASFASQSFLTVVNEPTLAGSQYLSTGTGLGLNDGGAQSYLQIVLNGASGSLEAANNGIIVKTSSNTIASRSILASGAGLSIANGDGVIGNPTLSLTGLVQSLAGMAGSGLVTVLSGATLTPRSIDGTTNQISVGNANAFAGNPTIGLASNAVLPGTGAMTVPLGTLAQQPAGSNGQFRFNTDSGLFEGFGNSAWTAFAQGGIEVLNGTPDQIDVSLVGSTATISIADAPFLVGPVKVAGTGTTSITPFANTMQVWEADTNNYELVYARNINNGSDASVDFVGYNDASDIDSYFVDMGITSSNYTNPIFTIFPANGGYVYTGGGTSGQASALLLGTSNAASDLIFFTGGTLLANTRATIKGNTGNFLIGTSTDTGYLLNVAGTTLFSGASEFGSTVLLSANPTLALEAATKAYVDNQVTAGLHIHEPVRVETTGNLTATYVQGGTLFNITAITGGNTVTTSVAHGLSVNDQIWLYTSAGNGLSVNIAYFVYSVPAANQLTLSLTFGGSQITGLTNAVGLTYATRANSGVGATLTNAGVQAALVVDGVALSVADRVMVRLQTAGAENGVYTVTTVGSGATNWVLTRATDNNQVNPASTTGLGTGDYFFTREGLLNAGDSHVLTTEPNTMIIGYTTLTYTQFSGSIDYVGGTNITVVGQTINVSGTIAATLGGTGTSTVAVGDLLYGSATDTWSKLPLGVGYKSLIVNASGTQVEWNAVALNQAAAVSGQLGVSNGGTGASTLTGFVKGNGTSAFTSVATIANADLTNSSITINGSSISLGGSATITAAAPNALTIGTGLSGTSYNGSAGVTIAIDSTVATLTGIQTLSNKRIDPRVSSVASASSVTPTIADYDEYAFTALAATLVINAPVGTPLDGNTIIFRFLDNGTPQTLTWNPAYVVIGVTLPTTTTANKTTYVGCIYNTNNTRWDVIAVTTQA
jgi:hypothetical protein